MTLYQNANHPLYTLYTFNHGKLMTAEIRNIADYIIVMYDEDISDMLQDLTVYKKGDVVYESGLYYIVKN